MNSEPMRFCVFKMWKGSNVEQILEYFYTIHEAKKYAKKIPKNPSYKVHVGEWSIE